VQTLLGRRTSNAINQCFGHQMTLSQSGTRKKVNGTQRPSVSRLSPRSARYNPESDLSQNGFEKRLGSATTCLWNRCPFLWHPGAKPRDLQFRRPLLETPNSMLKQNCHLDRTRISCHAALDMAACCFRKGKQHGVRQRHQLPQEIRGSAAQWRDLRFSFSSHADSQALMSLRAVWYGC
jgi:hypothetical protein